MKKTILFPLAFSLFTIPFTVNAATTDIDRTALDSKSQAIIAGFGVIEDIRTNVEGVNKLINDTEEDIDATNRGTGVIKSKLGGGENSESGEVIDETEIQEGAEAPEVIKDSDDSF